MATPPPAVVQIAQQVQRQEMGVVTYHLRHVFDVHAGRRRPVVFEEDDDLDVPDFLK